ncbi:hypothetical protein HZA57_10090 [Candidatus Poribacteria bacterium]|nr:hypothetical protein [Candidatus Poribacteria bacterium]
MRHSRIVFTAFLVVAGAGWSFAAEDAGVATPAGVVTPVGPPFSAPVVTIYVPPTRSNRPMAATEGELEYFDAKAGAWDKLLEIPIDQRPIRAVTGYPKNSGALYLVHAGGVSVTRDGGQQWEVTLPPGFQGSTLVGITVHPEDRKQAVLAVQGAAWRTSDFGQLWMTHDLPGSTERGVDIAFETLAGKPVLVYATDRALYVSDEKLKNWKTLSRGTGGVANACAAGPLTVTLSETGSLAGLDLLRPGYRFDAGTLSGAGLLAMDDSGFGGLFAAAKDRILFVNLQDDPAIPVEVHRGASTVAGLTAHPRDANAIYWAEGAQVYAMAGAAPDFPAAPIPVSRFEAAPTQPDVTPIATPDPRVSAEAKALLNDILSDQPPVEEVVAAALHYASYHEAETEQWKRDVRRKNLIPELAVKGAAAERPVDQYDHVTNYDNLGVATREDLYADDDVRYMNEYGVELRWNMSGLLFDRDQLMVSEETRKRAEQRNALVAQVTDLYFRRVELMVQERLSPAPTVEESVQAQLRLRQMTAMLNEIAGKTMFE